MGVWREGLPLPPGSACVASEGLKRRGKIACPGDLKFLGGQAIIITKNREKNVLIINAPL